MHPALRPENLADLPENFKSISARGVLEVWNLLDNFPSLNNNLAESQSVTFEASTKTVLPLLPVWYRNLDPAGLPSPDHISAAQTLDRIISSVAVAFNALQVIPLLRDTPPGVYPELWPRAWAWIEFLHIHHDHLAALPAKEDLYKIFMKVIIHFQVFDHRRLVAATTGVCAVVGRAWELSLDSGDNDAISDISLFVNWEVGDHDFGPIDEYLEGIGGGIEHLAAMLMRYLSYAVGDGVTPMSDLAWSHFTATMCFILRISKSEELASRLSNALNPRGIVPALLTGIFCGLPVVDEQANGRELISLTLNFVGQYSTAPPGRRRISEALHAGILRVLVLVASVVPLREERDVDFFLKTVLPPYMVYHSILVQMPSFLADVETLVESEIFMASPHFPAWQAFRALVDERLALVQAFDSDPPTRFKACDNLECQRILLKSDLRRCSTCLDLYYCSKQCQAVDWRAGHRDACRTFSGFRRLPEEEQCSLKDRDFLRALIRNDYFLNRRQIYTQQISENTRNPRQLCYVLFDYMHGPVSISVRPWPRDRSEMLEHPRAWETRHHNYGYRAAKSQYLEVHLMAIPNGLKTHCKFMPMRYIGSEMIDRLWSIVDKLIEVPGTADPTFEAAVAAEVELLLVVDPQIIHE
ncbi:hypothetical protein DFH06DRAFT_1434223 [Mycena polygramma]|nr:hypothetical protein DFH06DRAFT_1434223 [Mycena polygramma]